MKKGFGINSKLDFGLYEGYELGIVYAFDPTYLEWCIHNLKLFFVEDLDELSKYNVIYKSTGYQQSRDFKIPQMHILIDEYQTLQELIQLGLNTTDFQFSEHSKELNHFKKYSS